VGAELFSLGNGVPTPAHFGIRRDLATLRVRALVAQRLLRLATQPGALGRVELRAAGLEKERRR
jgi:hypothetical protein